MTVFCFLFCGVNAAAQEIKPKLVSINACADSLLLRLADPEQVLAVTDFPKESEAEKVLSQHPEIRSAQPDLESVLSLHPAHVLSGVFTDKRLRASLRTFGQAYTDLPVPGNFPEIYENIHKVAALAGHPGRGESMAAEMRGKLAAIPAAENRKRALFWGYAGHVPGTNTFEDAILNAAGLSNAAADISGHSWISVEELIALRPQVLILAGAEGDLPLHPAIGKALPEVKKVYLPAHFLECPGPESVQAVEYLNQEIYG